MKTTNGPLENLPTGTFKTIEKVRPTGALQVRRQTSGSIAFYWRYSIGTSSERVPIGLYDSAAAPKSLTPTSCGYSIAAARRAAESLALEHHEHRDEGGRPALSAAKRQASQAAIEAKRRATANSLKNLLAEYCDYLEKIGRRSHADARSIFRLHVVEAWPGVAAMPAKDVGAEHFADMMRRLIEAGKGRTANKLRSYARAAYQTAKAAKSKPSIPISFKAYEIAANPVAETEPDETQNRADRRPMTAEEMRRYWLRIRNVPGLKGSLLRLHFADRGSANRATGKTSNVAYRRGVCPAS